MKYTVKIDKYFSSFHHNYFGWLYLIDMDNGLSEFKDNDVNNTLFSKILGITLIIQNINE